MHVGGCSECETEGTSDSETLNHCLAAHPEVFLYPQAGTNTPGALGPRVIEEIGSVGGPLGFSEGDPPFCVLCRNFRQFLQGDTIFLYLAFVGVMQVHWFLLLFIKGRLGPMVQLLHG